MRRKLRTTTQLSRDRMILTYEEEAENDETVANDDSSRGREAKVQEYAQN